VKARSVTPKVAYVRDAERLNTRLMRRLLRTDSRNGHQEIIPGEDKRLVYFCFYLDRQSKPLASFAGRKLEYSRRVWISHYVQSFR